MAKPTDTATDAATAAAPTATGEPNRCPDHGSPLAATAAAPTDTGEPNRCPDHGSPLDEAGACDDCIEAVADVFTRFATALLNSCTHAQALRAVELSVKYGVLTEAAAAHVASEIGRLVYVALHPDARGPLDPPPPFVTYETMQQERKTLLRELALVEAERDQLKSHARVEALAGEAWGKAIALCEQYKDDGMRLHAAVTRVVDLLNRADGAGDAYIRSDAVRAALVDHEHGACGLCGSLVPDGGNADRPRISSVDPAWRTLAVATSEAHNKMQVVLGNIESEIATWGSRDHSQHIDADTNEPEPFERRKGRALQDMANADAITQLLLGGPGLKQPPLIAWDGSSVAFWYAVDQVRKQRDTEGEHAVLLEVLEVARHALALEWRS